MSIDYCCEEDFRRKYQGACLLMPALKLLSDNTPVFEGGPGRDTWPGPISGRSARLSETFRRDFGFRDYAEYLWRLPLIFLPGAEGAVYTGGRATGELFADRELTPEDIEHILSMTFLDVRLKHYIEIRGADSMPFAYVMAYLSLIKGLFFQSPALEQLLEQYPVTPEDIFAAQRSLGERGLAGEIFGRNALGFLEELLDLAAAHLEEEERLCLLPFRRLLSRRTVRKEEDYGIDQKRISDDH